VIVVLANLALAQINTVELSGTVFDPQGLAVAGAQVTIRNLASGAERTTSSGTTGEYQILELPPGAYQLSVEAVGFAKLVNDNLTLTLGVPAVVNPHLALRSVTESVVVTTQPQLIQTKRSDVSETVTPLQIENLPINGRNFIHFALLGSQTNPDGAPPIGVAPTSGLNFGGQSARYNQVSVDGADAMDNSANAVRATVSQESVQEFQILTSNYMPEYGRATGAIINIVTKSGSNQIHGNVFGFLRHSSLQARNPFSVQVDPATGDIQPIKQPFTRVQAGATLGGPIRKDKTFYFFSYELSRRQETGFNAIGGSASNCPPGSTSALFGLCTAVLPFFPQPLTLTGAQLSFVRSLLGSGNSADQQLAAQYAVLAGSASRVALNGVDFGAIAAAEGITPCTAALPLHCFPLPVQGGGGTFFSAPLPASYVPLATLVGNFPTKEATSWWSLRLDHIWNQKNSSSLRVSVSPSLVTGIEANEENQSLGENSGSRTSLQQARNVAVVAQNVTAVTSHVFNELRYQFARLGLKYGFSQLPGGSNVGINIPGAAFFGREPFSPVDRIEKRHQIVDNLTWIKGKHTFKFGEDTNYILIGSSTNQVFQLYYGGVYDFGSLNASAFFPQCQALNCPGITGVQSYGLGFPQDFIQGIGSSDRLFNVPSLGVFAEDTWKLSPRLTLNYGLRYDIEWTPTFVPGTSFNTAAEAALGVMEGIPVSVKNFAPRLGLAWDPTGSGKTALRASYGVFYNHPQLGLAFDSTTADGALSSLLLVGGGVPTGAPILSNPVATLNAASIFQGVLNTGDTCARSTSPFGYLACQQRFNPFQKNSIFSNQNFLNAGFPIPLLPETLPTEKSYVYGNAQQTNLTLERQLGTDWKVGVSYSYTHGLHLSRPRNINSTDPTLLVANLANALAAGLPVSNPLTVAAPASPVGATASTCGVSVIVPNVLGALNGCPSSLASLNGQFVGTAAVFNFFRPSGPNPSFASVPNTGFSPALFTGLQGLAGIAGYPPGTPGIPVPWSDVIPQESSGSSVYHGLTISVTKRFADRLQIFSNYTWSHAIDDSTDVVAFFTPQDNRSPGLDRGNSSFDRRHRWVTSAILVAPDSRDAGTKLEKLLANFTLSPIIEVSSGRPYSVLTGTDFNFDFNSVTDRASGVRAGSVPGAVSSPFISGTVFLPPTSDCPAISPVQASVLKSGLGAGGAFLGCIGNLGRNSFVRPGRFNVDLRLSRKFAISERTEVEAIAEAFNLLNRLNVADVSPLCDPTGAGDCNAGRPTAAFDQRQLQVALKLRW